MDDSGNAKLSNIGRHLKSVFKREIPYSDVKYIDPTYMIRAIATCSQDRIYCKILAHNAVHGAFAGFTGEFGKLSHYLW
jgi:6-phosphofructokinase 1